MCSLGFYIGKKKKKSSKKQFTYKNEPSSDIHTEQLLAPIHSPCFSSFVPLLKHCPLSGLPVCPSIRPSIHPWIHQSIHLCIRASIHSAAVTDYFLMPGFGLGSYTLAISHLFRAAHTCLIPPPLSPQS